jgi:DNA-binding transcriptional LysR family regulator
MHPTNIPDLSARELHAVLAVAEYRSFIAAAAFLKTSQPALTRAVMRVEDVLGVRLFDRSTRRVEITAAGSEFIAMAERMLNDLRISVRSMHELAKEQRGQIIVSSIMSVANGLLPGMVAAYRAQRPGIVLILREGVHGTVLEDVRSGVADLGITYVDDVPDFAIGTKLSREVFDVIVPRAHPLAKKAKRKGVKLADLVEFPLVSLPNDARTRRIIDGAASSGGHQLQHVVTVTQFATMISFVRAGVGLAIAPSGALAGFLLGELVVLPLTAPRLRRDIGLITLRERELSPAAKGLAQLVCDTWPRSGD